MICIAVTIASCTQENIEPLHMMPPAFMERPIGFDSIPEPEDNKYSPERWALGKKLFYDPIMSLDSTISCGSCHKAAAAFSDDIVLSLGIEERLGTRNTPSLTNVAYHPYYTREGGVPTLEMQILVPIQEHNEFDFNIVLLAERMAQDSTYVTMSLEAYDRRPDPFVITRSLACFERSFISGYSRYDHYANYNDQEALTPAELRGMELFFSDKTNCASCHSGFNFTNYAFENNGLYEDYPDNGRYRLTGEAMDIAKFKVPSLRNIELTAPYMHDGSLETLAEVIDHYNLGGAEHTNKSTLIKPLALSNQDKSELIAFLLSLTDDNFVSNPLFYKE